MEAVSGFTTSECADAVHVALRFLHAGGALRPVPFRIRRLIVALNVAHFKGRQKNEALRIEMVDRIKKAVQPWLGIREAT